MGRGGERRWPQLWLRTALVVVVVQLVTVHPLHPAPVEHRARHAPATAAAVALLVARPGKVRILRRAHLLHRHLTGLEAAAELALRHLRGCHTAARLARRLRTRERTVHWRALEAGGARVSGGKVGGALRARARAGVGRMAAPPSVGSAYLRCEATTAALHSPDRSEGEYISLRRAGAQRDRAVLDAVHWGLSCV